jgi:choline kinase
MKAVILAAGRGTRIRSVHGEHPKCLIDVDNGTILDHQLRVMNGASWITNNIMISSESRE